MNRIIHFDILKCLLIISVVIGHYSGTPDAIHEVIFWFHMPAFFMVAGYFMHTPQQAPWHDREYLSKQARRYVIPFFAWSIVGYALIHHEPLLKNAIRTLYAGHNNITPYGYPFWFINALLIGGMVLACIRWVKKPLGRVKIAIIYLGIFWAIAQWILPLPFPLPWSIDQGCGAVMYMAIGVAFHRYKQQCWHIIVVSLFCAIFLWWQFGKGITYHLNMSGMVYNHPLLDLVIPCMFTFVFYNISMALAYVPVLSHTLAYIGTCSITIFFTHAYILGITHDYLPMWASVAVAVACGTALHYILFRNRVTRCLFLGK